MAAKKKPLESSVTLDLDLESAVPEIVDAFNDLLREWAESIVDGSRTDLIVDATDLLRKAIVAELKG